MSNFKNILNFQNINIYIFLLLILILTSYFFDVIILFFMAFIIAYIMNPFNNWLCCFLNKTLSSFLSIMIFVLLILSVFLLISPIIIKQFQNFISMIPMYVDKIEILFNKLDQNSFLKENFENGYYINFLKPFFKNLINFSNQLINNGIVFFNGFFNIILIFVISFYMILELTHLKLFFLKTAKKLNLQHFPKIISEIDSVLSKFIRGQGLVCIILSSFYSIILFLIDIQFGILLGIFAGLISFIPYFGAFLGGGLTLILGFLQFGIAPELCYLALTFIFGQLGESYYLTPKFVGDAIKLNAIWIIFALLIGANLAGFVGILIALPVAAMIGVLVRYFYNLIIEIN